MKISLIVPLLNEAKTINRLLDSIVIQSRKPDEVILVDGGSEDETVSQIKAHRLTWQLTVRLLTIKGANCSASRNFGIRSAKYPVLALTDSGCVLDKDWLKLMIKPLAQNQAASVAGFYQVKPQTALSEAMSLFMITLPKKLDVTTYLPSSRSIAFTKKAWQKVGGYPEQLNYCDDLVFGKKLKAKTKMIVEPKALVYWDTPDGLNEFFHKLKNYSSGDVKAGYGPHVRRITSVFLRYLAFYIFPGLFILYLVWPILKFSRYLQKPAAIFWLPIVQVVADMAVLRGALLGLKLRLI